MTQFKIDDEEIQDNLDLADEYIKKLKSRNLNLCKIKFAGKLLEFKPNEPDVSFLGALVPQQLDIFAVSSQKTQPTSQVFQNLIQPPPASMGRGRGSCFAVAAIRC